MEDRLRRLETLSVSAQQQNQRLTEQNRQLAEQNQNLARQLQAMNQRHEELAKRLELVTTPPIPAPSTPPTVEADSPRPTVNPAPAWSTRAEPTPTLDSGTSRFLVGEYDFEESQFVLVKPRDPQQTPFELNFDLITELRYTGFSRSADRWTNSAGTVLPIRNFNTIEVNRNWFQFTGYGLDPRLQFSAAIFNSSTSNSTVFLGYLDFHFSKEFILSAGYYKLPGSREWLESFRYTLGADRTMATTFFRPNMSPGIWASGEPVENFHYIAMVANTLNGLNLAENRIGSNMAFGGSLWWEPNGKYGPGPSDAEWHEEFTPRLGTSLAVSREHLANAALVQSNPEDTLFRLSDGTPLATIGALSPGVEVNATNVRLWSLDGAFKYRGLSVSGEYYLRWLDDFSATGGRLPIQSLFTHGAYAQTSYFVIPHQLEGYARYSFVSGQQGEGNEWSGGLNWYVLSRRNWRMTFDVTQINHSPAQNQLTGYRAGESGTLFQVQMLTDF